MDTRNRIWTSNGFDRELGSNNPDVISVHASVTSSTLRSAGKVPHLSSDLVGVQSRFRRKYYHKVLPVLLVFLILILMIAVIVLALTKKTANQNVCNSKECLRIGASLLYTMDITTDPCEDFYQFTCGNWAVDHPKPDAVTSNDWFREAQARILRSIREYLKSEINDTEPKAVAKSKLMYQACMDVELMDELSLSPLMNYLKLFKLPSIPPFLNLTVPEEERLEDTAVFSWIASLVQIKKSMGIDMIIGFDIFPDPVNRSVNRIAVGTPEIESALPFNDDYHKRLLKAKKKFISSFTEDERSEEDEDKSNESSESSMELSAYVSYIRKVITIIVMYLYPSMSSDGISTAAGELTMDAIKITKKLYKMREEAENLTKSSINPLDDILYLTINELQNQTDKLVYPNSLPIWEPYLKLLMDTNEQFNVSEELILTSRTDIMYLQLVTEYLIDMSTPRLQFYIWVNIVEDLILHTSSALRQLHSEYMRIIIQIEGSTPRSMYCANGINNLMGMAVSFSLTDDRFIKESLPKVDDMLYYIREAFYDLVKSTSWMDTKTKQATLQKAAAMKSLIGFPDWIANKTILDEYYSEVNVSKTTHLDNMINVLTWEMSTKVHTFKEVNHLGWATSPTDVNAFHTFQSNTITVPIAILQYPFYHLGLEALNYGGIGTILGHELTHGFDDSGRMYDRTGNMRQWWSNDTILEYVNRTECFVEQYGHYILHDIGEYLGYNYLVYYDGEQNPCFNFGIRNKITKRMSKGIPTLASLLSAVSNQYSARRVMYTVDVDPLTIRSGNLFNGIDGLRYKCVSTHCLFGREFDAQLTETLYTFPKIRKATLCIYVDGELTLGENIADNGGLREAFYAYKKYVRKFGKEDKLPGLEQYSHEQLFFISFGNLWCETLTPAASRYALEDSHCPGSIRLKGVLSNSEEFARTFRCKRGSGMFPNDNKCRIW